VVVRKDTLVGTAKYLFARQTEIESRKELVLVE